jgi:hypothetical protein
VKRVFVGILIGILLGLAVPAAAHRDRSVSKHLYNHLHNVAHRLIDVEKAVWGDIPGFLACLTDTGTYACPVPGKQVVADFPGCPGRVVIWNSEGTLTCADTDFIRTTDGKTEFDRLLCHALKRDFGDGTTVAAVCDQV